MSHSPSYSIVISLIRVGFMLGSSPTRRRGTSAHTVSADFAMPWMYWSHWSRRIFIVSGARWVDSTMVCLLPGMGQTWLCSEAQPYLPYLDRNGTWTRVTQPWSQAPE